MDSVMEKLYNGLLYPAEQAVPRDSEYTDATRRYCKLAADLEERLKNEDYKLVEEMCDYASIMHGKESLEFFRRGFSLGLSLMKEAQDCLTTAPG